MSPVALTVRLALAMSPLMIAGCALSTEQVDPSLGDVVAFCDFEMTLVCESCPERCDAHPSGVCLFLEWPCDPQPNQSQVNACMRALSADACSDHYPDACDFMWCAYERRPGAPALP